MKKPVLLIFNLLLAVAVLSVVRTFISNNIATSGIALGEIEQQTQNYKLANSLLEEKLYSLASLTNISQKAYDLGYEDQVSDFVISQNQTVALNR